MEVDGARPAAAFEHELASKDMILAHTRSSIILFTPFSMPELHHQTSLYHRQGATDHTIGA
jgi:hypothetical protein